MPSLAVIYVTAIIATAIIYYCGSDQTAVSLKKWMNFCAGIFAVLSGVFWVGSALFGDPAFSTNGDGAAASARLNTIAAIAACLASTGFVVPFALDTLGVRQKRNVTPMPKAAEAAVSSTSRPQPQLGQPGVLPQSDPMNSGQGVQPSSAAITVSAR